MVRYPSYLRRQSLVSKKHLKLFTLLVMLLFFSISCSTLDEADKIQDVKVEAEVSSDCADNFVIEGLKAPYLIHRYTDANIIAEVVQSEDRMYLNIKNRTKYPILLHVGKAQANTIYDEMSQLITYDQSMQNKSHFEIPSIKVEGNECFQEQYVAINSITFDAFVTNHYIITNWAYDDHCKFTMPYSVINGKKVISGDINISK